MMTTELINKLQELVNKNGDAEIHICDTRGKNDLSLRVREAAVFYDDGYKDICISITEADQYEYPPEQKM